MITEYGTVTITKEDVLIRNFHLEATLADEDGRRALAIEAIEWAKGRLENKLGSLGK